MDPRLTGQSGPFPVRSVLIAWLLICAVLIATALPRILAGQLPDPDDALRLVQLREWFAGQGWFDMVQHRIDPPHGTPMHWSRLVDIPLIVVASVAGEAAALVIVPLLTLGALVWAVGRLAHRVLGPECVLYACLICGFLPPLVAQVQPMRIDHHGWQAVCAALALLALTGRSAGRSGAFAGSAMAAGLTISLELLPLSAAFAAVMAARWWRDPRHSAWLVAYLQSLALSLAALFLLTRGFGAAAPWCDAISPPQLAFFAMAACAATLAGHRRLGRLRAAAVLGLGGAAGLAVIWLWAPQCLAPPFAGLDPLVREYWYVHISEGQPLWHQTWDWVLATLLPLLAGLAACALLWRQSLPVQRALWAEHGVLLLAALVLGLAVSRSMAFAAVFAAVPLGWLLARLLGALRQPQPGRKFAAGAAIVMLLLPAAPMMLAARALPAEHQRAVPVKLATAACDVRARAASLNALPQGVVFAPLDLGPSILLETRHSVIATSHHRAEAAMADVIAAFIAPPQQAQPIIARHGASVVALCTDLAEAHLYAQRHPGGLAAHLTAGKHPDWLEPVAALTAPQFKVFRVRPGESAAPPR